MQSYGDVVVIATLLTALTQAALAIRGRKTVLVAGPPRGGKTAVLRCMAGTLRESGRKVAWFHPDSPVPSRESVVLIDDAQQVGERVLVGLSRRMAGCIIVGPAALATRLKSHGIDVAVVILPIVGPDDVPELVAAALRTVGDDPDLVSPGAIAALAGLSNQPAGSMLAMVRLSIFLARMELSEAVRQRHVEQAAAMSERLELPPVDLETAPASLAVPDPVRRRRMLGIVALCGLGLGAAWFNSRMASPGGDAVPAGVEASVPTALPASTQAPPAILPVISVLPPPGELHVSVFAPCDDAAALSRAGAIVQTLRVEGYSVAEPIGVRVAAKSSELHYFFAEDAAAVAGLAAAAHGLDTSPARLVQFPSGGWARPGAAEIWLPSSSPATAATRSNPHGSQQTGQPCFAKSR